MVVLKVECMKNDVQTPTNNDEVKMAYSINCSEFWDKI